MTDKATRSRRQPKNTTKQGAAHKKLRELKRKGLYSGSIAPGRVSSYQYSIIAKFNDVIKGDATVVKTDKAAAREYKAAGAKVRGTRVVVNAPKTEQVRFDKRTRQLVGRRHADQHTGETYRLISYHRVFDPSKLPRPPKGVTYRYRVAFHHPGRKIGYTAWVSDYQMFLNFMQGYEERALEKAGARSGKDKKAVRKAYREMWTGQVDVEMLQRPKGKHRSIDDEDEYDEDEDGEF